MINSYRFLTNVLTKSLSPSKEGSGEYKRSVLPPRSHDLALCCCLMGKHPVNVVYIPMLPATIVLAVFMHSDLWTIEDARLGRERERERLKMI